MQIKNLSIILAFLSCAVTTTLATPIPNSNDVAELSNDEVLNNNSTLSTNDVSADPENSAEEVDPNLPVLDKIEDSGNESDNETYKYEAGSTYVNTEESTEVPTEYFGVGDPLEFTEEPSEAPTQAPLNNANEDSDNDEKTNPTQVPVNDGKDEESDNDESTKPTQGSNINAENSYLEDDKKEDKKEFQKEKEQVPVKGKKRVCRVKVPSSPKSPSTEESTGKSNAPATEETTGKSNAPSTEDTTTGKSNAPTNDENDENTTSVIDANELETDAPENSDNENEKTNEKEDEKEKENENEPVQKLENAEDSDDAEVSY